MDDKPSIGGPADARGVNGLVMNLFLPGLGSLYCGKAQVGAAQLVLFIVGIPLCWFLVGIPMIIGAWVWSAIVGFQLMASSTNR